MPSSTSRSVFSALLLATVSGTAACGGGAARYQGMEANQLFQVATNEFESGDHGNAIEALDRLLVAHGDWDRIPEARLMLGDVYYDRGDYLTARAEYRRFLDRYAGHERSADAALGICKSLAGLAPKPQRDQAYTQEAMSSCRNVVVDFAGRQQAAEAAIISNELRLTLAEKDYMNADFYFRRRMYDSAIKYYEFVVNLYPESPYAPQALLGLYQSNQAIGYDDLADEARDRLLLEYPDSEAASEVRTDDEGR
ncbi:MAG: hypothetical protein AMS19_08710 [Gemmatimonas sp. SG8_23]|jgi:outer membrane protein assembly factor BamD|nr:MAG: hypothetical protein AMS19_08710 [Gemmatimonas sp. SG8_23]